MPAPPADAEARCLYRVGGMSALAIGIGYIAVIALYVPMGAPPNAAEARLAYMARNVPAWWAILGLSVLTDVLFLPVAAALYVSLRALNRYAMLAAAAFVVLFVVLDLAVTWPNYAVLIELSGRYTQAADQAQRAAIVAAAQYPSAIVESELLFFYNSLTLALGILIAGFIMRNGPFGNSSAYLGIVTGILGVVSVAGPFVISALSFAIIVTSLLTTVWLLLVGRRLLVLVRP